MREPVVVAVGQSVRLNVQLELSTVQEAVTVSGGAQIVDTSTNALGRVVTGRELVDLPLNGRNFTQLGLLQTGVAPLTAGVATAGGSLRQGQAYAVNGMRPEQNIYLVDGTQNMNRMDGGYAVKIPVDAIAEFRILTQSAPPEYGGTAGATTSVVTRGGSNQLHGSAYEFVRNDAFDARNFFSSEVEPLNQHQFGATAGGPLRPNRAFFFGYYEGFRNSQGLTTTATVPTAQERQGDFSGMSVPLINFAAGGVPIPRQPDSACRDQSGGAQCRQPLSARQRLAVHLPRDRGRRLRLRPGRRARRRQPVVEGSAVRPLLVLGRPQHQSGLDPRHRRSGVSDPRRPVDPQPARLEHAHHGTSLTNALRVTWFRHKFLFDQRLNRHPPSELGFGYEPANDIGQGPPFFNVSGYTPIGGAITGPRNSTQTTFEMGDGASWSRGRHLVKVGGELRHTSIDMFQAIAPNAFYVFAGTFPTNNAIANLLLGAPVTFYQGLGDFNRGVRLWNVGAYAQDEWRLGTTVTLNYGVRYERINPFTEIEDRLNGFIPGVQSQVRPDAPKGLVFPGDPGVARGIAEGANTFMPRVGVAWDPTGEGRWSVRSSYGLFYDQFQNGAGTSSQVAISAIPAAQFNQFSGAGLNFANPYQGRPIRRRIPSCGRPPSSRWTWTPGLRTRRTGMSASSARCSIATSSKSATSARRDRGCRATSRRTRPSTAPARRRRTPTAAASTRTVRPTAAPAISRRSPCCGTSPRRTSTRASSASRGDSRRASASTCRYWLSKALDHLSAMNLSGAAAKPLAGENDLAQNPFDLEAEYGPSLFDARHRFVASASWEPPVSGRAPRRCASCSKTGRSTRSPRTTPGRRSRCPTPRTSRCRPTARRSRGSPPAVPTWSAIRTPARTPSRRGSAGTRSSAWIRRRRPDSSATPGATSRGRPAYTNVDLSLVRNISLGDTARLQLRVESFNVLNHPNFGLPVG